MKVHVFYYGICGSLGKKFVAHGGIYFGPVSCSYSFKPRPIH